MDIVEIFAFNLKRLRSQADETQAELAEKIDVAHATVAAWESGRRWPGVEQIVDLAKHFKIEQAELFRNPKLTEPPEEILKEFARLLSNCDLQQIRDAIFVLESGQPNINESAPKKTKRSKISNV